VKVLLVDDDYEEAELFEEALNHVGNSSELLWFSTVAATLEALSKGWQQPDIIFLDLNIPQVSGKELLKILREHHLTKNTPVVIYSTSISRKDIEDTSAWSVKAYLQKPEEFRVLCQKLREILK
jgi:CheY-like chemotaxis protein